MRYLRKDSRITLAEPRTKLYLLASFLAPILVLLVIAFKFKLYPFTSDCFATESLRRTYFPVIAELRRKILSEESLFYSWNAGGGVNFWAWISAYASSPFVLLYLLFPEDSIASVTQIIFALKASFAAVSLFLLLWKKENVVSPISVALSVAYGLCGYVLTYSQEPWLLDSVILLPLLIRSYSLPAAITNACSAFSASYLAVKYRKDAVVRLVPPVLCGSFVMTFLSVRFSRGASLDTLRILLAVMLILMSLWFLFLSKKITIQPKVRNGVIAGGLGGIMNGLFATGGPPVVVFFLGATATHAAYFATIQTYFAFNNVYASAIRILNGQYSPMVLLGILGAAPGMLLGNLLGGILAPHLPDKVILKSIYIVMLLSGIGMLMK